MGKLTQVFQAEAQSAAGLATCHKQQTRCDQIRTGIQIKSDSSHFSALGYVHMVEAVLYHLLIRLQSILCLFVLLMCIISLQESTPLLSFLTLKLLWLRLIAEPRSFDQPAHLVPGTIQVSFKLAYFVTQAGNLCSTFVNRRLPFAQQAILLTCHLSFQFDFSLRCPQISLQAVVNMTRSSQVMFLPHREWKSAHLSTGLGGAIFYLQLFDCVIAAFDLRSSCGCLQFSTVNQALGLCQCTFQILSEKL